MRVKNCCPSRVKRYRGLRAPRCNDGAGCSKCWVKWNAVKRTGLYVVGARHD